MRLLSMAAATALLIGAQSAYAQDIPTPGKKPVKEAQQVVLAGFTTPLPPQIPARRHETQPQTDIPAEIEPQAGHPEEPEAIEQAPEAAPVETETTLLERLLGLESAEPEAETAATVEGAQTVSDFVLPKHKPKRPEPVIAVNTREPTPPETAPRPVKKPLDHGWEILAESDAELYNRIFSLQAEAKWSEADKLMAQLGDYSLRGHVLYQRYMHPTAYITKFTELVGWMDMYADHPGADKIYKLALAKMPSDFKEHIRKPDTTRSSSGFLNVLNDEEKPYRSAKKRSAAQRSAIKSLQQQVRRDLSRGAPTKALGRLKSEQIVQALDTVEYDQLRAKIANSFMLVGKLDKAWELSSAAARRSAEQAPQAGWVAGLVAWRRGDYRTAASMFEMTAMSPYNSSWTASAGAYWASRAHMRAGNVREVSKWLQRAASQPRTFYGLIATRALGWDYDFNWTIPAFTEEHQQILKNIPAAQRASALVKAGQFHLAEKELRKIRTKNDANAEEAMLAYANHAGLPAFAMRIAQGTPHPMGGLYDAALYPLCPWEPKDGYKVDRALIHALIRQESRFNPSAESRSGAAGLMQLMPKTASYVAGSRRYSKDRAGKHSLKDPQTNLDIGQSYVQTLLNTDHVGTELFSLVTAYNAGPGNLAKWKREHASMQNDPLLFIESIPLSETRAFVEKVMANYWIYRMRMDQPSPSLDAVAEGGWARYVALDGKENDYRRSGSRKRAARQSTHPSSFSALSADDKRYN